MAANTFDPNKVVKRVHRQLDSGMASAVSYLQAKVKANLSGPPGSAPGKPPGKVDGDLIAAVERKIRSDKTGVSGYVGILTDWEQAAKGVRLARGFAGTDSLGRKYSQAGRPWLWPVVKREWKPVVKRITG